MDKSERHLKIHKLQLSRQSELLKSLYEEYLEKINSAKTKIVHVLFNSKIVQWDKKGETFNWFFSTVDGINPTKTGLSVRIEQELTFSHVATLTITWESHFGKLLADVIFQQWQSSIIVSIGYEDEVSNWRIKGFFGWDSNTQSNIVSIK